MRDVPVEVFDIPVYSTYPIDPFTVTLMNNVFYGDVAIDDGDGIKNSVGSLCFCICSGVMMKNLFPPVTRPRLMLNKSDNLSFE